MKRTVYYNDFSIIYHFSKYKIANRKIDSKGIDNMKKISFLKNTLKRVLIFIKIYNACTDNIDFINDFISSNINVLQAAIIIFPSFDL